MSFWERIDFYLILTFEELTTKNTTYIPCTLCEVGTCFHVERLTGFQCQITTLMIGPLCLYLCYRLTIISTSKNKNNRNLCTFSNFLTIITNSIEQAYRCREASTLICFITNIGICTAYRCCLIPLHITFQRHWDSNSRFVLTTINVFCNILVCTTCKNQYANSNAWIN